MQSTDIFGLLVKVYGSTDLFVDEYREMLAKRLLQSPDFKVDGEVWVVDVHCAVVACMLCHESSHVPDRAYRVIETALR